jgi:hypothetical protein
MFEAGRQMCAASRNKVQIGKLIIMLGLVKVMNESLHF